MSNGVAWRDSALQREMSRRMHAKRLDSEKRCVAISKSTGQRCKRYADKGQDRCQKHTNHFIKKRFDRMSRYAKAMGKTLTEKVAELQSADHPIHSIRDELDLTRVLATDAVALYEAAHLTPDEKERDKNVAWAGALMKDTLNNVRDMAMAYVKIEREFGASMTIEQTQILVSKFTQLMDRTLKEMVGRGVLSDVDAKRACIRMQELVEERLVVSDQPHGSSLTPDQDMRDMIDSVPRYEGLGEGGTT